MHSNFAGPVSCWTRLSNVSRSGSIAQHLFSNKSLARDVSACIVVTFTQRQHEHCLLYYSEEKEKEEEDVTDQVPDSSALRDSCVRGTLSTI
jgi:hypothetical protein